MIRAQRNADGTTTITTDEATRDWIWAIAHSAATDTDLADQTRTQAATIADALEENPAWHGTEA